MFWSQTFNYEFEKGIQYSSCALMCTTV